MQMYFPKKVYQCTMRSGANPQKLGEFSRIFVLKVNLQSVMLVLTVSVHYRKNWGAGCTSCSPIILLREQLLPCFPGSHAYDCIGMDCSCKLYNRPTTP